MSQYLTRKFLGSYYTGLVTGRISFSHTIWYDTKFITLHGTEGAWEISTAITANAPAMQFRSYIITFYVN